MTDQTEPLVAAEVSRLRGIPPFAALPEEVVADLVVQAPVVFYRHGAIVCHPDIADSAHPLWIVRQGSVRAAPAVVGNGTVGEETLQAGAVLPLESVLSSRPAARIYTAREDTFLWRIEGPLLARLLAEPAFLQWVVAALQLSFVRLQEANLVLEQGRQVADQALALPARTVGSAEVAYVAAQADVGEIASLMALRGIGSVVVGSAAAAEGIVTRTDLVNRAMAADAANAAAVMTANPAMIEDTASVLDAALEMERQGIRHLLIRGATGEIVGIVSERDLFRAQQRGLAHVHAPIDEARSVDEIVDIATHIRDLMVRLFRQGMAVTQFARLVASLNDRLARRLLTLIVGERPGRYCWLSFGSEGREEQGFVTDQDNGIVFVPPAGADVEGLRQEYLAAARAMNDALHAAGFERCKGNIMAGNPEWCLTLAEWQARFSSWIHATTPTAILNATIFFDFRAVGGDAELAERMRDHLNQEVRGNTIFLHMMAKNALEVAVPIGAMNRFKTDGGEHKGTLDLKTQGTRLFVDVARIYALAHGVRVANTEQRLATIGTRINRSIRAIEADIAAFRFVQTQRLRRQLDSLADGGNANRIDPNLLNDLDQRMLRESLRQAQSLQERLRMDYQR